MAKQKNHKESESDELFHEAALNSALDKALLKDLQEKPSEAVDTYKNKLISEIENRVKELDTQWDVLRNMVDGGFTERFINIMANMPDKDFARNYLKLIEHFKPKLTRAEAGSAKQKDNIINIQTIILNSNGEQEIIDITDLQKKDEKE